MRSIEFIGLPGSGKSTLMAGIVGYEIGQLKCVGLEKAFFYCAKNRIDRIYRILLKNLPAPIGQRIASRLINRSEMQYEAQCRFLGRQGGSLRTYLNSPQFEQASLEDRTSVLRDFLQLAGLYGSLGDKLPKEWIVLFEEGFVQRSMMFVSSQNIKSPSHDCVREYMKYIPISDLVIYVQADIARCIERMKSRPRGLTRRMSRLQSPEEIRSFMLVAEKQFEAVVDWLKSKDKARVLVLKNEGRSEVTLRELKHRLVKECVD